MKLELSKSVRIRREENYKNLRLIEQRISDRIRSEFASEISDIKSENEKCIVEEKSFNEKAKELLMSVNTKTLLRVKTQVGPGSTIIQEYLGNLEKKFNYNDRTFNFIDPNNYDGKPFTIGFSCLLSIQVIKETV